MKKNETFMLKWTDEGAKYQKQVNRKIFLDVMESIKEQFINNNEVSIQFVKLIPKISCLEINKDRNRDEDIPKVIYKIGDKTNSISINRNHKIIWGILDECCKL